MTLDEFKDYLREAHPRWDLEKIQIEPCVCGGYGCFGWVVIKQVTWHFQEREPFTLAEDE